MTSPETEPPVNTRRKLILDAFDAALDIPEDARAAWLQTRFGDDVSLIAAVEALLAADELAPSAMPTELSDGEGPSTLVAPPRVGAYALIDRLGGGGMGEVWLGRRDDGLFEHEVAIKLMRPSHLASEALAFFNTERRALARMRHRHIARLFDGGVTPEGLPWIIMERIDGVTLDAWFERERPSEVTAVRLMIFVAEAVQYAHQRLVVHADLKPSNILVDGDGEPSLVDFGISSLALPASETGEPGAFPRTPAYASPQRLAGQPPAVTDDVFALGLLLQGLVGKPGEDLAAIIAKATQPAAEDRYATAQAFADDLKAYTAHRPVKAHGHDWRYEARLFVERNRWPLLAATGVALAGIVALIVITALYIRSETRFQEVRALAGYMLGDLYDGLERLPGASSLRARTADVGRDYLERLSHVPGAPYNVARDVAIGYGRVGHTLAVNSTNATGDTDAGAKALDASEKDLRALLEQHPDDLSLRRELARTLTWKSSVLSSRNDSKGAYAALDEGLALYDAVLKANPRDLDAAYGHWNTLTGRADILYGDSRYGEAIAITLQAMAAGRDLPADGPNASVKALMLAAGENMLGDATWDSNPDAALPHYMRAADILEQARNAGIMDIRVSQRLAVYYYQVAASYSDMGKPADALPWVEKGTTLTDELSRYDDSVMTLKIGSLITETRISVLSALGRVEKAKQAAQKPVAIRRKLFNLHPDDIAARVGLASSLRIHAQHLDDWHQPAEACVAMREARQHWDFIAAHSVITERWQKLEVTPVDERLKTCPNPTGQAAVKPR